MGESAVRIEKRYHKYLGGELFNAGLCFPIVNRLDQKEVATNRFDLINQLCRGKSVLHIGCADHIALIPKKISAGTWMHGFLTQISARCLGVDISQPAIDYLQKSLGLANVICADLTTEVPAPLIERSPWDKVFLGEVVEHINDPIGFLQSLKRGIHKYAEELIITVPNATRWENFENLRKGIECINSDHRFWFTPYTLAKTVSEAGFNPKAFYFVTAYKTRRTIRPRTYFSYRRLIRFPALRDTIILTAGF